MTAAPPAPEKPGVYVHVPFCAHRCSYCSFAALTGREGEAGYFRALLLEIASRSGEVEGPADTLYFGGGTPSYVEPERLGEVFAAVSETFGLAPGAEVTAEGNPDDLSPERLEALGCLGVNRLSVGVQSLEDAELTYLERRHDAGTAIAALKRAISRFPRVSADLMIGVPGQTRETLRRSVAGVLETGVTHLSVYLLELEKAPKLRSLRSEGPGLFADDAELADRWEEVDEHASSAGLPRYETSNWAVHGHESRHNLKYWTRASTLGLGVSAHSFDGEVRRANAAALGDYARRVDELGTAFVEESRLSRDEAARERVLLGLRLSRGVPEEEFEAARTTLTPSDRERLADTEAAGLLARSLGRVKLTRRGVLLSNEVFAALL